MLLSSYLVFLAGMLTSIALKEQFYFIRKMTKHTSYMLEMREEEKILELQLQNLRKTIKDGIENE